MHLTSTEIGDTFPKERLLTDVMDDASRSVASPPADPRRFVRRPVLFASIKLGQEAEGFILNISEGGLCVQTAGEIAPQWLPELRFQRFQSGGWIRAQGRVVWRSEKKTIAGVEFVDLSAETRQEIRKWLFFGDSLQKVRQDWGADARRREGLAEAATDWADTVKEEETPLSGSVLEPRIDALESPSAAENAGITEKTQNSSAAGPRIAGWLAFAIAILLVAIAMEARWPRDAIGRAGRWLSSKEAAWKRHPLSVDSQPPQSKPQPPPSATPADTPQASFPIPSPAPTAPAGIVLQVAAMSDQGNANTLAESLRRKNFPAFVSERGSDGFYRVLVGPYGQDPPLHQAKNALEKQHLAAIEKRWSH